jgi:hypothetical protein
VARHITWNNFLDSYIKAGVPGFYRLRGSPVVQLYVSESAKSIGLRIYLSEPIEIPSLPFKELLLELKMDEGEYYIDFSTSNSNLFQQFYSMMTFISDSVQLENRSPLSSIIESIGRFRELISNFNLLGDEKVIGIWGELLVLELLLNKHGAKAVFFWKGPDKTVHDFRLEKIELEVKTTRNEERMHIISRLSQLDPSPEYRLYMCSLQVAESNANGLSLPECIEKITNKLKTHKDECNYFDNELKKEGYKATQAEYYTSKYYLRTKPKLIEILESTPKINRKLISDVFDKDGDSRIDDVHYRLDVSGLGFDDTDERYKEIL